MSQSDPIPPVAEGTPEDAARTERLREMLAEMTICERTLPQQGSFSVMVRNWRNAFADVLDELTAADAHAASLASRVKEVEKQNAEIRRKSESHCAIDADGQGCCCDQCCPYDYGRRMVALYDGDRAIAYFEAEQLMRVANAAWELVKSLKSETR
jgi:hypothetical protein